MAATETQGILASLQEQIGIQFHRPELLLEAITHTSYVNEKPCEVTADNERLEFLGDAVLDLLVAEDLYLRFPAAREGELTAMRAALVRADTLAQVSRRVGLPGYILLGRGEDASGGRERIANLCATLEAVVGAAFLDQGIEGARRLVRHLLGDSLAALAQTKATRDPKSLLQEQIQGQRHCTPVYRTVSESGPDHAKEFIVEVLVADQVLGKGSGFSKQAAEQAAARAALRALDRESAGPEPAGAPMAEPMP